MRPTDPAALLMDSMMPDFDIALAEHAVVQSDTATTFATTRDINLLTVHSPVLDLFIWLRTVPARIVGRHPTTPTTPKIGENMALPGWGYLGQTPGHEIVFGAVGRFWQSVIQWRDTAATDFTDFAEPGWGKIAADFSVRTYGASTSLLCYECRFLTTDPGSRVRFGRHRWLIRPFVRHIMRTTLRQIKANAESLTVNSTLAQAVSK